MRKLKNDELKRLSIEDFKSAKKAPLTLVLDNIRSMHNVGSVFRTADAFRIEKICLCGITARPPHRDITKTALGATESVNWQYYPSAIEAARQMKKDGYILTAIEQTDQSAPLDQFSPEPGQRYALVFGNEVEGIGEEVIGEADLSIEIPQFGTKHSLNISVSTGIVLWHFIHHLPLK